MTQRELFVEAFVRGGKESLEKDGGGEVNEEYYRLSRGQANTFANEYFGIDNMAPAEACGYILGKIVVEAVLQTAEMKTKDPEMGRLAYRDALIKLDKAKFGSVMGEEEKKMSVEIAEIMSRRYAELLSRSPNPHVAAAVMVHMMGTNRAEKKIDEMKSEGVNAFEESEKTKNEIRRRIREYKEGRS